MIVNDAFELYTTIMGWHINNALFYLLMGTGIVLIPFAFIIINNLIDAKQNRDKDDIGVAFFNATEMQLYVAFFVLLLCINPMITLSVSNLKAITHTCDMNGDSQELDNAGYHQTGTTFDRVSDLNLGGSNIKMPVVWFIWDYIASSISLSAKAALPCQTDIRTISTKVSTSRIEDPALADEYGMFLRDCWRPSLNQYLRDKPSYSFYLPDNDINWAGSEVFTFIDGYYNHYRAEEGLSSFPYDASRDEAKANSAVLADYKGFPFCREWWMEGYDSGLRSRLMHHFKNDHSDLAELWPEYIRAQIDNNIPVIISYDNMLLKTILLTDVSTVQMQQANRYPRDESWGEYAVTRGVAVISDISSIPDRTKALMTQTAAPMLRAILLMVITLLLPLLLIASGYSLKAVVTLMMVKFSIFFWAFLFALASWVDNYLLMAWSGVVGGDLSQWILFTTNGGETDLMVSALNFITRWMHLLLPMVFTTLVSAVGMRIGNVASPLTTSGGGVSEAGGAASKAPADAGKIGSAAGRLK